MKFICDSKYLLFPASHHAKDKHLFFRIDGELVYDLSVQLDYHEPDYTFPLNVERFWGKEIDISVEPMMELKIEKSDSGVSDTEVYSGRYRPLAHFTAKRGWLNDPNGLVYYEGKYLMFYQHNPVGCFWGNMHWGYAVSDDLMHWKEQDIALFPDKDGTIFSGSAIIDKDNVTGLKENEHDVILLFYTAAGSTSKTSENVPFTQSLAYSTDGGKTFKKYQKNPLIHQIAPGNRDPKVIYYEPSGCYIMALYLKKHEYALFSSRNLLDWELIQKIEIPGEIECPDFYPLPVDGDMSSIKWVLIGASDKYLVGDFDGAQFVPEGDVKTLKYGGNTYAAQSWSNMPDGRRVRTTFAGATVPGMPFGSCMSIPQEMSLKTIDGGIYLCASPVSEIGLLYADTSTSENIEVSENKPFRMKESAGAYDISLKAASPAGLSMSMLGFTIDVSADGSIVKCGEYSVPIDPKNPVLELRIILDKMYAEIFVNEGSSFIGMQCMQDSNLDSLVITSGDGKTLIEKLSVSRMKPFWE